MGTLKGVKYELKDFKYFTGQAFLDRFIRIM